MSTFRNIKTFKEVRDEWQTCLRSEDPVIMLRACAHALAYAGLITTDAHMDILTKLPTGIMEKTRL